MFAEKKKGSGWLGRLVITVILLVAFYAAGLAWFVQSLPREASDAIPRAEAIVVLTGGAERVDRGLELLDRGLAEKLFISGVYHAVEVNALIELAENQPEHLACCIVLGYEAGDTRGNAIETAAWMKAEGYSTLILVTAVYHMPRSLIEFQRVMPEALIVPHPVYPRNFHLEDWYAWPGSASLLITEFAKYLLASAWAALSPPPGEAAAQ
jgi:uncharacterized SAM-binding protein YcdF (DUF218 family)